MGRLRRSSTDQPPLPPMQSCWGSPALMLEMLSSQQGSSNKRRKQGDRVFGFKAFCGPGYPVHFSSGASFRENVVALLQFGNLEAGSVGNGGMRRWSFQLELQHNPPMLMSLYVVEEVVEDSQHQNCHHCKCIGWGHHMICSRRYHFVLPSKKTMMKDDLTNVGGNAKCGAAAALSKLLNSKAQLMHGVVHSNGFGHLLYVNGIEGGSEIVSGRQIMDLWERICAGLHLRNVSLTDAARKGTMSLRLVYGVAYGESWFGRWGYRFGRGSYGVTRDMYQKSIEALQSLPLCLLVPQYGSLRREIPVIIAKYQMISGNSLITLGHLFHFVLELKRRLPPDALMAMDYHGIAAEPACRWSTRRVEMAAQVIVEALRKAGKRWVQRQDVRDAARLYIGDTGLLDFVLKSIGNHVVGSYMVRRMVNPVTKVLEYCLEDISHAFPNHLEDSLGGLRAPKSSLQLLTRVQLMRDLFYLYKHILKEKSPVIATGIFGAIPVAVRIILDSKLLVKGCDGNYNMAMMSDVKSQPPVVHLDSGESSIKLYCSVHLQRNNVGLGDDKDHAACHSRQQLPPFELITLPAHATIGDLKKRTEAHFKNVYLGLRRFVAESVVDVGCEDSDLVLGRVELGRLVIVSGKIEGVENGCEEVQYEGGCCCGSEKGAVVVVDCLCGAREEDGERMVSCDVCEVWQHTRCLQIPNSEEVPKVFLCRCCERDIVALPALLT